MLKGARSGENLKSLNRSCLGYLFAGRLLFSTSINTSTVNRDKTVVCLICYSVCFAVVEFLYSVEGSVQ